MTKTCVDRAKEACRKLNLPESGVAFCVFLGALEKQEKELLDLTSETGEVVTKLLKEIEELAEAAHAEGYPNRYESLLRIKSVLAGLAKENEDLHSRADQAESATPAYSIKERMTEISRTIKKGPRAGQLSFGKVFDIYLGDDKVATELTKTRAKAHVKFLEAGGKEEGYALYCMSPDRYETRYGKLGKKKVAVSTN